MEVERCPFCKEAAVIAGWIAETRSVAGEFVPERTRILRLSRGVALNSPVTRACASCGHVWSALNPAALRDFIRNCGDELGRQQLDEIINGPYRDLPDTDFARSVAEKVWRIDVLIRSGRFNVAVREYRDMKAVTWDQAHKDMNNWAIMRREDKLALFGWAPKKKGPVDELA